MRKLIVGSLFLCLIFCLAIGMLRAAGHGQPPSPGMAILHLNDCELPCWAGIVPGKTAGDEAQQRLVSALRLPPVYSAHGWFPDPDHGTAISLFITDQAQQIAAGINVQIELARRVVDLVSVTPASPYQQMPSLGDVINAYGPPSCVLLPFPGSGEWDLIYNDAHEVTRGIIIFRSHFWRWTEAMQYFTLYGSHGIGNNFCRSQFATQWRGLVSPERYGVRQ